MKKTYLLALAALALAFSCQKNSEINDTTEVTPKTVMRTVTCTIAGSDSKVALNANTGKTEWEVDDEILFHGKYTGEHKNISYSVVVKLTANDISEDKKSFTATIPAFENAATQAKWEEYSCKSNIYAAYPASAVAVHYGDNWYNKNIFNETNLPLMSGFNDDYDSDHFTFYNLTGILSFVVEGDFDTYTLTGNGSEAVAYTGYTSRIFKKNDENSTIQTDWVYAGTPVATVSGSVVSGKETRIYIPGGVTFSGGFTIMFSDGGTPVKTLSTTKSVEIPINSYRPMGDVTNYLKDYVAPSTHDSSIDMSNAIALDANGGANCYIVDGSKASNAGQVFTFKAYKGNSDTGVGTVAAADILWETYNNDETVTAKTVIEAVDFEKTSTNDFYTIVFKMPDVLHPGNAVICAKDAGSNILWSWHIWVPATSITDVDAANICGATMMDRNLGALEKVSTTDGASVYSLGMIYQWGRKDPFPGGKRITDTWPNPATVSGTEPSVNAVSVTMAYATAHPTVFASVSNGDWQTTSDMTRWNKDTKTENDPCPPGYKIPYGERGSKPLWNTSNIATAAADAGLTWEVSSTGYWFRIADGTKELVFPFAGYVSDGTSSYGLGYTQTRAAIWSLSDSGSSKYHLNIRSGSTMVFGSTSASRGCSVRCVAE